ncbi:MAG: prenyltransferase [Armatimonadota bacterium]
MSRNFRALMRTSRPRFWIYLAGPWILGTFAGAPDAGFFAKPIFWVGLAYCLLPANLLVYGVNDWFDLETDRLNAKKSGDAAGYEALLDPSRHRATAVAIVATQVPFLCMAAAAWVRGAITLPMICAWGGFLFTGIGYSAPPVRAKARPVVDSLFNALYACPGFAAFFATGAPLDAVPVPIVLAAWFWCMAMHAFSAVPDIAADREAGVDTVATLLGAHVTVAGCALLYGMSALLTSVATPWPVVRWGVPLLGLGYLGFMGAAWRKLPGDGVFAVYRAFPIWNACSGFLITMMVLWSRWPHLRP